ncbi:MAG TPA: retropepsin-like aspartic protease [Streptosporangiaceae bacterium]|nr:retropepsin-like aspartic protease [Streptosporangiaceae bacterium]
MIGLLAVTAADCEVSGPPGARPSDTATESPTSKSAKGKKRTTKPGEVSVPVEVITTQGETMVLVPVRVNGRGPYDFVLDTGASSSTVSRSLMRRLRLPRTGSTAHVRGVTGATVVPMVTVERWTVGGQRLHGDSLPAVDLGGDFGAGQVSGLLGSDELRRFGAVRLDYKNERLVLRDAR